MNEKQKREDERTGQQHLQKLFKTPVRPKAEIRKALIERTQKGGITLVVGAGVSIPRNIPNWENLAKAMWKTAFGKKKSPWEASETSPTSLPQFLPIVFELVYRKLGEKEFAKVLKENLYSKAVRYPRRDKEFESSSESLAVLGRLIVQEFEREQGRRIDAVITLNADELLEQAAITLVQRKTIGRYPGHPFHVIGMSTHRDLGRQKKRRIPIYHVHGFIPQNPGFFDFNYMLVFTDHQYWSTSASALTFANRIVSWALSESCCVFIGLSMTDINLIRWLALRALEFERDVTEAVESGHDGVESILGTFSRHYWIRPRSTDPTGFLSWFMRLRGIESVEIGEWKGKTFQNLIEECFPNDQRKR